MATSKALWTLYFVVFTDFLQLNFSFPLFPAIVASFGGDEELVTSKVAILAMVGNAAEAIGSPIIGILADRFGRKLSLMLAAIGAATAAAVFGFAGNYTVAILARVVLGFCGNTLSVAQAMATDLTTEAERPDAISKLMAGLGLGFAFGPALGGFLFSVVGVRAACLAGSSVSILNCIFVYLFLHETLPEKGCSGQKQEPGCSEATDVEAPGAAAPAPAAEESTPGIPCMAWVLFLAFFLFSPFIVILEGFGVLYLSGNFYSGNMGQATRTYSMTFAGFGAVMFVVSFCCYGTIIKCLGFKSTLVTGGVLASASLVFIAVAPNSWGLWPFVVGLMLLSAGCQLCYPAVPSLFGKLVPPERMGRAFGINNMAGVLARVVAPVAFTPLFDWWNRSIWLVSAALVLAFTLITLAVSTSITGAETLGTARAMSRCQTAPAPALRSASLETEQPELKRSYSTV